MHRTRRGPAWWTVAHWVMWRMRLTSAIRSTHVSRLMRRRNKSWASHGPACHRRNAVLLVDRRLRVHALLWTDVAELRVV